MFPWQSGSNGREETQVVHLIPLSGRWLDDASHLQRHVNLAIAYSFWKYFQATDDLEFMAEFGAEVIFEISRYWADLAQHDPTTDRYQLARGSWGPTSITTAIRGICTRTRQQQLYQRDGGVGPVSGPRAHGPAARAPAARAPTAAVPG